MQVSIPKVFSALLNPCRYKGAKGGRGSGKSHFFAQQCVLKMLDQNTKIVCIREIQKSLKHSAKSLIESKISELGLGHLFDILQTEIRSKSGDGLIIFQGMNEVTADSIKSLEGFDIAWVEEAQTLSFRSLKLLRPTIRKQDSEIWFSWNPENKEDAVDQLMSSSSDDFCVVHANYSDNPFLPETLKKEMEWDRVNNLNDFGHVWLGEYNEKSEAQVFHGKWCVEEFNPKDNWDGPYFGLDFGFAKDPTALVKCYIADNRVYIHKEWGGVGIETDDIANKLLLSVPEAENHVIRADNARPESISYLRRHGLSRIEAVKKGKGSIEDGVSFIRSHERVVIHPDCEETTNEFRLYSHKIDKRSGDIMPLIVDENNHFIDAIRYSLEPLIKNNQEIKQVDLKIW